MAVATAAALVVAAAAGTLLALAASSLRSTPLRVRMSICTRQWTRVDRSAQLLGIRPLQAEILDPNDRRVWVRRRRVGSPQRPWRFRTWRAGDYQVVFRRGQTSATLDLLVAQCSRRVAIDENDRRQAMFRLTNMTPGTTDTACVRVTYSGTRPAHVRLYGTTTGSGLGRHLLLVVTRGSAPRDEFPSCRTFVPDRRNYVGLGRGVVFVGTLAGLPQGWASALDDATRGSVRVWRRGQSHAYRLAVTLPRTAGNDAQGLTAKQAFVWEARPLPR
ncbi:MAG: hypothetical protein ACXWYS_02710 [Gaiellaceae bacterium]